VHLHSFILSFRKRTKSSTKLPHANQMACLVCFWPNRGAHLLTPLADSSFNPFPNFGFSGPLRPIYPLSPTRVVPDHIPRPDYAEDGSPAVSSRANCGILMPIVPSGIPVSENRRNGQPPRILSLEEQEKMRTVCRVGARPFAMDRTSPSVDCPNSGPDHASACS
jgi:hypothetical protein